MREMVEQQVDKQETGRGTQEVREAEDQATEQARMAPWWNVWTALDALLSASLPWRGESV